MTQDYGAANQLVAIPQSIYRKAASIYGKLTGGRDLGEDASEKRENKKTGASWHDEMVRKATESFTKPVNKAGAKKVQTQRSRPGAAKTTGRKPVPKKAMRKK